LFLVRNSSARHRNGLARSIDKARYLLERAGKIIASLLEDFERLLQDE